MKKSSTTATLLAAAILQAGAALLQAGAAMAQTYPARPVHLVVPLAAGGGIDTYARAIGAKLGEAWKQPVIVENRPGAGNIIGADYVAKSAPDGYTLLISSASLASNAALFRKLPFDAFRDFAPVTQLFASQLTLAINPKVPANTAKELIDYARANPGKLNYGSTGIGSGAHLLSEMLKLEMKIDAVHVPYKGDAPLMPALLGGDVQFAFLTQTVVLPHAKTGRLRVLASTGSRRLAIAPDLPTLKESGIPIEYESWIGIFAPGRTPRELLVAASDQVANVLRQPDMIERMKGWGVEAATTGPDAFGTRYRQDLANYIKVVKEAGIPLTE